MTSGPDRSLWRAATGALMLHLMEGVTPMSNPSELVRRVSGLHNAIGSSLDQFGGFLRCETCRKVESLEAGAAGRYTAKGWPKCCGYTMRWWTQRQINAGEVSA